MSNEIFRLTKNFVHFQNLKLPQKRLNSSTFLEIHPFFTIRVTRQKKQEKTKNQQQQQQQKEHIDKPNRVFLKRLPFRTFR